MVKTTRKGAIISFGFLGAVVGLVLSQVVGTINEDTLDVRFYHLIMWSLIGFFAGSFLAIILSKNMTKEDWAKGLEYECPNCKKGVYETEQHCRNCGVTNEAYTGANGD